MVDWDQTKGFAEWCQGLARAKAGDKELQLQLLENGHEADAHLNRMRDDQETYAQNLEAASKHYTDAELKALRTRQPMSIDMLDKITQNVLAMAAFLFIRANPNATKLPHARELPYTFIFRYALAGYLVALRWIAVGAKTVKSEKIRNDIVDATYVAYSTYFQGLLSNDVKANETYADAKFFLGVILANPPPPDHIMARIAAKPSA
jgi:hypothetical protein